MLHSNSFNSKYVCYPIEATNVVEMIRKLMKKAFDVVNVWKEQLQIIEELVPILR